MELGTEEYFQGQSSIVWMFLLLGPMTGPLVVGSKVTSGLRIECVDRGQQV